MGKQRKGTEGTRADARPAAVALAKGRPPVRIPDPENPLPPLPPSVLSPDVAAPPASAPWPARVPWPWDGPAPSVSAPAAPPRSLRHGCYLLRYTPISGDLPLETIHYDGTMRVERNGSNTTASGDLYLRRRQVWPLPPPRPRASEPNPANGIPIFPRGDYRFYVRVTRILPGTTTPNSVLAHFELHRFEAATNDWVNEGAFTALLAWTTAPSGYPSPGDYLAGEVKDASGSVIGNITMGWVSEYLRRAVIEIDRVAVSEPPLNNATGVTWRTVFDPIGWDVTIVESNADIAEPSGPSWSDAEMHAAMLARRDQADLDREWRYHILCVRRIDSTPRGIMYDAYGSDSNNVPREGIGISSHWTIPNADPWGKVKGQRFGTAAAPYFRTALHEIGHAMGLYHNTVDMGIMNTTDVIAEAAIPPTQFPDNIQWSHAPDDQKRLRHLPDIWVRPGGTPFGLNYSSAPISPNDLITRAVGLELVVTPLLEAVPLGAPVRIDFALVNVANRPLPVPDSLSMKGGHVAGKVVDPSGTIRSFSPILLCVEEQPLRTLAPGERVENSLTLLRGRQGALFPAAGMYTVSVEVEWDIDGTAVGVVGETTVMVEPAQDEAQAIAALKVLSSPDAHLTLVFGGDHLADGVEAIQAAIQNPVLRPHFAVVEARRVGRRFRGRKADLKTAAELLDENCVLTSAEVKRAAELIQAVPEPGTPGKKIARVLKAKAAEMEAPPEVAAALESL